MWGWAVHAEGFILTTVHVHTRALADPFVPLAFSCRERRADAHNSTTNADGTSQPPVRKAVGSRPGGAEGGGPIDQPVRPSRPSTASTARSRPKHRHTSKQEAYNTLRVGLAPKTAPTFYVLNVNPSQPMINYDPDGQGHNEFEKAYFASLEAERRGIRDSDLTGAALRISKVIGAFTPLRGTWWRFSHRWVHSHPDAQTSSADDVHEL